MPAPFILLDDAREGGARDARCYTDPAEVIVAQRPEEVGPALARLRALNRAGAHLAGYLAYEAGLALEPRLAPLAPARTGAAGPLLWFGAFERARTIAADAVPGWLAERSDGPATIGPLTPQLSPGAYAAAFARLAASIAAGDIYQANLTFPLAGPWRGDPLALYAALRVQARSGHGGVVHDGSHWLLSLSPELFFALADGELTARPMKGTRPRARDAAADRALADALAASPKDRAENLMIVDLTRNDLSRIAEPGSVRVEAPFAVESYPTVHQMVSTVRATLRGGLDAIDALAALFPCGSITGTPKIRAMELIAATERDARGAYCGAIGRIDPPSGGRAGDATFNVAIRTLRLTPIDDGGAVPGGRAVLGVGSAIVADSDGDAEWRECLVKGGFVRTSSAGALPGQTTPGQGAAASLDLIETMRVEGGGVPLLGRHLARLEASAAALGFAFDRAAAERLIDEMYANRAEAARLRLTLSRSGAIALELSDLPRPLPRPALCAVLRLPVDPGDWRLRHKTSDRGFYAAALQVAQRAGADEALLLQDDPSDRGGLLTEGSFTSLFVERDGLLLTPPLALGLLPGVLRAALIEEGRAREAELRPQDLTDGFLIGNALRGLMPARLMDDLPT